MTTNIISSVTISRHPHMVGSGYCEVGKSFRKHTDTIKIYYEIHGNGPNKLLFIMGT